MPKNADPLPIDQRAVIYDWINEGNLFGQAKNQKEKMKKNT